MNSFLNDTVQGLRAADKYLLSKYFYDEAGDRLFQQIMNLEEYYLSRAEREVFELNRKAICDHFPSEGFRLAELGAGDGVKTLVLLEELINQKRNFTYNPIDISGNALDLLAANLKAKLPDLAFEGMEAEYFEALQKLSTQTDQPLVLLFLGSNIGNFRRDNVDVFMDKLSSSLRRGDQLLIGVDLKKNPNLILGAYNDSRGVTAAFNFNILKRINRELDGNFDLSKFRHYNTYDPHTGESRSFLISLADQEIHLGAAQESFTINAFEAIHTETSRKYSKADLKDLAEKHGFKVSADFRDGSNLFTDQIWERL
jgi:dimethylhistidine N-methyltransferase